MRPARQPPTLAPATARRAVRALLGGAAAVLCSAAPAAAATFIVNISNALDIGTAVAAPAGATVFRINPATGAVNVQSGAGYRLTTGQVRALVTISCQPGRPGPGGPDNGCNEPAPIRVGGLATPIGRAGPLGSFTVSMLSATLMGGVTGADPITFTIAPVGNNGSRTFYVGADFPLLGDDSGRPTGNGENSFFVHVLNAVGAAVASDTDKGRVRALRALAAAKASDLGFGRIARPAAGSGTVSLDAATGERVVTGGFAYPTPAPARAAFTVTGEGGQAFSASIPSTIQLAGPQAITVTTSNTLPATPSLSGALGAAGSLTFHVGGSFPISGAMPTGAYTGTLTVTIDYN
jgi:hypothetical protein